MVPQLAARNDPSNPNATALSTAPSMNGAESRAAGRGQNASAAERAAAAAIAAVDGAGQTSAFVSRGG